MEIQTEITKKTLSFINDLDFRQILLDRLKELDNVFLLNANYSTIFLAISTLEGILKYVANNFKSDYVPGKYLKQNGDLKKLDELTIDELYVFLSDLQIMLSLPNFEQVFKLFRDYRNFIHPQAQKKKDWPIDLGQAQMAIGLVNSTIGYLAQNIFLGKEILQIIEGNPDYDAEKVLHLNLSATRLNSFLILKRQINKAIALSFDLDLPPRSVFNFVFNFANEGNFRMLRLDTREDNGTKNCLLRCDQKYFWREIYYADQEHPPKKQLLPIEIKIDFPKKEFSFKVDGALYIFKDKNGTPIDLFGEIKPNLKIGFFNEVRPLKIINIVVSS